VAVGVVDHTGEVVGLTNGEVVRVEVEEVEGEVGPWRGIT
jgi:hypothetical protein